MTYKVMSQKASDSLGQQIKSSSQSHHLIERFCSHSQMTHPFIDSQRENRFENAGPAAVL